MTAAQARAGGEFIAEERGIHEVKPIELPPPTPATAALAEFVLPRLFQSGKFVTFSKFYEDLPR